MPLQPGSRIGSYEIRSPLGEGGMGEVYLAHDARLDRDVALKTLPASFAADEERVARFEREARLLAALNHPNIATIYGFENQGGVLALVMELVDGETLSELLRRSQLPGRGLALPVVLRLARQIVDALDAAHEKGIVHRDLKPSNIKLTTDDVVKVLDFGLAKAVRESGGDQLETRSLAPDDTKHQQILGTAAYMSPEQARGYAVDRRTDIWAFGCVLFEMLTGRPAFAGETATDTMAAVLGADVDWAALPADTPASVRKLAARCLERNAKLRLRDIGDARPHLDDESSTQPASSSIGAGVVPRVSPGGNSQVSQGGATAGMSRRRLLTGGAALGLLGAGFAGGAFVTRRRDPVATPSFQRITFRRGVIRTARFAPDSQTVLYGALWDGDVCRVYTVRGDSPESSPLALPPAMPLALSSSGELALALGDHFRGIMTYGTLARVSLAGGAPREVQEGVKFADWSPDGRDLAVVRRVGDGDRLEFPLGTSIAEPAGGGFGFPRVSPRGDAIAVFELDSPRTLFGRVAILERSGRKRAVSARYFNVFGLAWKGDEVWFTAADDLPLLRNTIHAMDAAGVVRIVARIPGNASLHDIAPDGRVLIARTDDRAGISVLAPGDAGERDLSWLDATSVADISRDGRYILFSEFGVGGGPRSSIYLRGTDGSPAVRLGEGRAQALSPDGRWAIGLTGSPHLDLIPTGPGQAARLERPGMTLLNARWLADGRVIVRARAGESRPRLYALDVAGSGIRPVTPEGLTVGAAGWWPSPDGKMIAVSTERGPELFAVDAGSVRRVPGASGRWQVVGWIETGLLISDDPAMGGTVFRVDPVTGRRNPWADIHPRDPSGILLHNLTTLVVTPDGRGYGYSWHRATSDLYLVQGWAQSLTNRSDHV
jgi:eukaryotic-like serine/threonine-protein kinase